MIGNVTPDERPWWQRKTTYAAIAGTLSVVGTAWAFAIDASPIAKAVLASLSGICGVLEGVFVAARITRISGG